MGQAETQSTSLKLLQLGGMDERASLSTTPNGSFIKVEGFYPSRVNSLQRLPGKTLFQRLLNPILSIHQTFDNQGNIIVQTRDAVYITTADEFFGRTPSTNLTPAVGENEDTMAYALIVHREAAGTDGGQLDAAWVANTFYKRKLTDKLSDATSFATLSTINNQFTLGVGTYRFTIEVNGCNIGSHVAKLIDTTGPTLVGTGTYVSTSNTGTNANTHVQNSSVIECRYNIASGTRTFEIQHACNQNGTATVARGISVAATGVQAYYLLCRIIKE